MRRFLPIAALLLLGAITWMRQPLPPPVTDPALRFVPLKLPSGKETAALLGPFRLQGAWQLKSRNSLFGGYSGLVPLDDGHLLAIGDRGGALRFAPPGPLRQRGGFAKLQYTLEPSRDVDAEAAARDPATGDVWVATETSNAVTRLDRHLRRQLRAWPEAMREWNPDSGPEAMARLADGRFVVVAEGTETLLERRRHHALVFPRDPTWGDAPLRFVFLAPAGELPTDMVALPDGRLLVLLRRITPFGFAGRIMIADPAEIRAGGTWRPRTLALLTSPIPRDNFEAMTVTAAAKGKLTVWVMSDDNGALFQRSLLLRLTLDPAKLPARSPGREKARESLRAPSDGSK